jgi:hypothetical protein
LRPWLPVLTGHVIDTVLQVVEAVPNSALLRVARHALERVLKLVEIARGGILRDT